MACGTLLCLCLAVMTITAQRLEGAADESRPVTTMGLDVMHDSGLHDLASRFASLTQRLAGELCCPNVLPDAQAVPLAPWLIPASIAVMNAVLLSTR
jgi:hypothetical protein